MKAGLSTKILALGLCAALAVNGNVWSFAAEAVGISKEADENAPATQSEEVVNEGGESSQESTGGESGQTDDGSSDSGQGSENSGSEDGSGGTETGDGSDETGNGSDGTGDGSGETGDGTETGDGSGETGDGTETGDGSEETGDGTETGDGSEETGDGTETGDGSEETGDGSETDDGNVSDNNPSDGDENGNEDNEGSDVSGNDPEEGVSDNNPEEGVSDNNPGEGISDNGVSDNGVSDNGVLGDRRPLASVTTEDGITFSIYADSKDALSTTEDLELTAEKAETDLEGVLELPEEIQILLDAAYGLTLTSDGEEVEINDSIIVGVKGIPEEAENLWALFWDGDELKDAVECRPDMKDSAETDENLKEEVSLRESRAAEKTDTESTDTETEFYFDANALGVIEMLSLMETEKEEYIPAKNFTDAGPFVEPVEFGNGLRMMKTVPEEEDNNVELNKKVVQEDGTYKIRLEAYTTGTVISGGPIPTDIVLVLDESGSMDNNFVSVTYTKVGLAKAKWRQFPFIGGWWAAEENYWYYIDENDEYVELNVDGDENKATWYYEDDEGRHDVGTGDEFRNENIYIRTTKNEGSRISVLKKTALQFVDEVQKKATTDNLDHRIAVVGFSSKDNERILTGDPGRGDYTVEDYQNAFQNMNTSEGQQDVKDAINALRANGQTRTNDGMTLASNILFNDSKQQEKRNRVVIMFTDGAPNDGGTDDEVHESIANDTISKAKDIKAEYSNENRQGGATIYTIGIFSRADANDMTNIGQSWAGYTGANRFMNLVSSNYPTASSMNEIGSENQEKGYYLTASNTESLNDIFKDIADNIDNPGSQLGAEAVVKDAVSPYFELPENVENSDDIKYFTANYKGNNKNWENAENWDPEVPLTNGSVRAEVTDGDTLNITGFDFHDNYVSDIEKDDGTKGCKLIIEFPIEVKDDFIGGNNVLTNGEAGIYADDKAEEPLEPVDSPKVNVPIRYFYNTIDRSIYVGDTYEDLSSEGVQDYNDFFWKMINDGGYKTAENEEATLYHPNGINNAYVSVTYKIIDNETDNLIAEATLPKATPLSRETIRWNLKTGGAWDISKIAQNKTFRVEVTLTPDNALEASVGTDIEPVIKNGSSNLYVFKPNITFKDQMVFLGDKVDLTKTIIDDPEDPARNMTWECGLQDEEEKKKAEELMLLRGSAPKLTYGWVATGSMVGADLSEYEPKVDTSFTVTVARSHAGVSTPDTDITDYTIKKNDKPIRHDLDCISPGNIPENPEDRTGIDFVIHVVGGKIDITKVIDRKSLNTNHGDPIFTFKIERIDGDNVLETFYRTVRFDEEEGSTGLIAKIKEVVTGQVIRNAETLDRLPRGTYRVTELDSMRYQVTDDSVETDTTCTSEVKEKSVIFNIGTPESSDKHSWEAKYGHANFVNDKINDTSYSDTDVVVNKYKFDGSIQPEGQDDMESTQNP